MTYREVFLQFVLLVGVFTFMVYWADDVREIRWGNYLLALVCAMFYMLGASATLFMVIFGTLIALVAQYTKPAQTFSWQDFLENFFGRLGITGNAVLLAASAYHALGGNVPLRAHEHPSVLVVILSFNLLLWGGTYLLGELVLLKSWVKMWRTVRQNVFTDTLLITVGTVYAPVVDGVGMGAGLVILGLLIAMAYRYQQIYDTRQTLMRRVREIETLKALGETINANLEFDEVLETVYEQISRLVTADVVFVAIYNADEQLVEYPLVRRGGKPVRWQVRQHGRGLTDWVLRERRPLLLNDLQTQNYSTMNVDIAEIDSAAYMGVPLLVADKLVGALGVTHDSNPEAFESTDLAVLQAIASQVALSIRNATLYQRTSRLAHHMSVINKTMHEVLFRLESEDALREVCAIARNIGGGDKAAIWLTGKTSDNSLMEVAYHHGLTLPVMPLQRAAFDGVRAIPQVALCEDSTLLALAAADGFQASLEVPLRSGSVVLGVIGVYYNAPCFHDGLTVSLLETLANQVAASLDNAELLQTLELYASEQSQLVHLSRMAGANLELEGVVQKAILVLRHMLDVQHVVFGIYSEDETTLTLYEVSSARTLTSNQHALEELPELARRQVLQGEPKPRFYAPDAKALSAGMYRWLVLRRWQTFGVMPMLINHMLFGVVLLGDERVLTLSENTLRLLELATNQIAPQLKNAYIYEETSKALAQQLEQLALIEEIAQDISKSLDQNSIIKNVLEAALRATQAQQAQLILQLRPNEWEVTSLDCNRQATRYITHKMDAILQDIVAMTQHVANDGIDTMPPMVNATVQGDGWLGVSLLNKTQLLGVLRVIHDKGHIFTLEHTSFISSLAGHATIAIANARLLDEQQYQIRVLNALRALSLETLNTTSETEAWQIIIRHVLALFEARECALYGYDRLTDELIILSGVKMIDGALAVVEPHIAEEAVYRAARTQVLQVAQNLTPHPDEPFATYYATVIALPIFRHQQVSEVLAMGFDQARFVSANQQQALAWLSVQLSGLLENINLNATISEANQRMRVILDSTRDGILLLDLAGRLQVANRASQELLALPLSEHLGESLLRVLRKHKHPLTALAEVTPDSTQSAPLELQYAHGGITCYVQASALAVRDGEGTHIGRLLLLRDITEEKRIAKTREELQKMIVHDLRSPAGAIFSSLTFMLMLLDEHDSELVQDLRQPVSISLESVVKLLQLTDNLLDLPRMKDLKLVPQPIAVSQLVKAASDILVYSMKDANITLELQAEDIHVNVDKDILRRVLVNLLHNALKFTPERGKILVATQPDSDSRFVRLLVCDTGPGIPAHMRERIFNEYEQVETQRPERGGKGTGIGLTFCKLAVERHGGRIWVMDEQSGLLSGACIAMTLPLAEAPASATISQP